MKEYIRPEVEIISFASEEVTVPGDVSGSGPESLD